MRILFLSSANPSFNHLKASYLALGSLLEECAAAGHSVRWATVGPANALEESAQKRLAEKKISHYCNVSQEDILRRPRETAELISKSSADVYILFWDSFFEYLLPYMHGAPIIGYLAKDPATVIEVRWKYLSPDKSMRGLIESWARRQLLKIDQRKHRARIRHLACVTDISAAEARYYEKYNISCEYLPNTFPDGFGEQWYEMRKNAESQRARFGILGNIGQVFGTGNFFGLSFLGDHVLKELDRAMQGVDWEINICGQGKMDEDLRRKLTHPRINIKGFVDDIDEEMLANPILLNLNNAGPLVTGYTRVIYAFSSGSCLIAHKKLTETMPEVRHGYNALLGEEPEEIAALVRRAYAEKALREEIGRNARSTYVNSYHPRVIAHRLLVLAKESLHNNRRTTHG